MAVAVAVGACSGGSAEPTGNHAPEFPPGAEWFNAAQPVTFAGLEGKVVLPVFWASSCIGCLEELKELERLQAEFPTELVVLGVHSGKFPYEKNGDAVAQALSRHDIGLPVVNDPGFEIWEAWQVGSWPTAAVVDPKGRPVARHSGADLYEALQPAVERLVEGFADELDPTIRVFPTAGTEPAPTVLRYPGSVLADPDGGRLFIADTGHNRVVIADLTTGDVKAVLGSGESGYEDGPSDVATFSQPRGLALDATGTVLFVADTGNHRIRTADLTTMNVATLAGSGRPGTASTNGGVAREVDINSPYGLDVEGNLLFIAMPGQNQVWQLDLRSEKVVPVAGAGREGVINGEAGLAELAAPTDLAIDDSGRILIADSGGSSIRVFDPFGSPEEVRTIAGGFNGLFEFGDRDESGAEARFQRPMGVTAGEGAAWVVDTFNSKVKRVDPTGRVTTVAGSSPGWQDGPDPLFSQPEGIDYSEGSLYIADTGNHSIRVVDLAGDTTSTFILKGIELLVPDDGGFTGTEVTLDPVEVGPGPGRIVLNVAYPPGYQANEEAPSRFNWTTEGGAAVLAPTAGGAVVDPTFPMEIDANFAEGDGTIQADLWLVYCDVVAQSICLFDRARIEVPLQVRAAGPNEVVLEYRVILADGL